MAALAATTASRRLTSAQTEPVPGPQSPRREQGHIGDSASAWPGVMGAKSNRCGGAVAKLLEEIGDVVDPAGQFRSCRR